jgi:hypothetical protein
MRWRSGPRFSFREVLSGNRKDKVEGGNGGRVNTCILRNVISAIRVAPHAAREATLSPKLCSGQFKSIEEVVNTELFLSSDDVLLGTLRWDVGGSLIVGCS